MNGCIRPNYFEKTIKASKRYERREKILTMNAQKPSLNLRESHGVKTPAINSKSPVEPYKNSGGVVQARRRRHRIWIEEIYKTGAVTPVRDVKSPLAHNRHSLEVRHSQHIDEESERVNRHPQHSTIQQQADPSKRRRKYRSSFRK